MWLFNKHIDYDNYYFNYIYMNRRNKIENKTNKHLPKISNFTVQ